MQTRPLRQRLDQRQRVGDRTLGQAAVLEGVEPRTIGGKQLLAVARVAPQILETALGRRSRAVQKDQRRFRRFRQRVQLAQRENVAGAAVEAQAVVQLPILESAGSDQGSDPGWTLPVDAQTLDYPGTQTIARGTDGQARPGKTQRRTDLKRSGFSLAPPCGRAQIALGVGGGNQDAGPVGQLKLEDRVGIKCVWLLALRLATRRAIQLVEFGGPFGHGGVQLLTRAIDTQRDLVLILAHLSLLLSQPIVERHQAAQAISVPRGYRVPVTRSSVVSTSIPGAVTTTAKGPAASEYSQNPCSARHVLATTRARDGLRANGESALVGTTRTTAPLPCRAPRRSAARPLLINMHIPLREGDVQPGGIEAFLDLFVQMEMHRPVVA
jgi:hypothetical protein